MEHRAWIERPPTAAEILEFIDKAQAYLDAHGSRPSTERESRRAERPRPRPSPITVTLRTRYTTCGTPGCHGCPHGPYLYAIIRSPARRQDVSLGRHPTTATFYRRLGHLAPTDVIRATIAQWKGENHDKPPPIRE